ncbi:MAG: SRPBCC domain-containing protein [Verrucomicrobiota bacterium]
MPTVEEKKTARIERVFDANPARVFEAWTNPEQIAQWWGCEQTVNTNATLDLQVGGELRFEMKGEGGQEHLITGKFIRINKPSELSFSMCFHGSDGTAMESQVSVSFVAQDPGQTRLILVHENLVGEMAEQVDSGWGTAFDKLAKFL